jgi:glutathione synthase
MAHIFFIDPLEKLNIKKDSTIMMALTFQELGHECYLLFEKDFYITNDSENLLKLYKFSGSFKADGCYVEGLTLGKDHEYTLCKKDVLHMRIDPPYDTRYQRYLWMLDFLENSVGLEVLNSPLKIMKYNEKLVAYKNLEHSHLSYIGSSEEGFVKFTNKLKLENYNEMILKPLDLYSGIGVEKVALNDSNLIETFNKKVTEFQGAIVAQPFIEDVYNGEYRSIYFDGEELGTILKKPNKGEFLANIAQGAHFEKTPLPAKLKETCDQVAKELYEDGVRFLAFDLLGGALNEINITCPGLLVEVSYACKKNLTHSIARKFKL